MSTYKAEEGRGASNHSYKQRPQESTSYTTTTKHQYDNIWLPLRLGMPSKMTTITNKETPAMNYLQFPKCQEGLNGEMPQPDGGMESQKMM